MNTTANIINRCFNKKLSFVDFTNSVFGLFKGNFKDLAIITIITQLPLLLLTAFNASAFVINILSIIAQVIYIVSIVKLIDNRAKGNLIGFKEAILLVKEKWLISSGVIILQSFLLLVAGGIPFAPILANVFLAVAIPIGILQERSMFESVVESFKLVKNDCLNIFLKLLIISAITGIIIVGLNMLYMVSGNLKIIVSIAATIIGTSQILASTVLFYNIQGNRGI
ncbi:MAG: hypothetical protein ACRCYE_06615 [Sarcina sp.]